MAGVSKNGWNEFTGPNAAYLLDLFEQYRANPESVPASTRQFFERRGQPPVEAVAEPQPPTVTALGVDPGLVAAAVEFASAIRAYGCRAARLDPLGTEQPGDVALYPEAYGLREADLASLPASIIGGPVAARSGNALEAIQELRRIYQHTTGYEFDHVSNTVERTWIREAIESQQFLPPQSPINELKLLERLTQVGGLERFLHLAFPGQTRFSLEGLGMLVPILDEVIGAAAEVGTRSLFVGMAHRGRLNVLAHSLGKPYEQIIAEFLGRYRRSNISRSGSSDEGWLGDVKYHLGARLEYRSGREVQMTVHMAPNPSHLEWVNPVVEGMTRADMEQRQIPGPIRHDDTASLAVIIHGDAAFPGQGIVAETLNLSRLPGYRTGGTLHIIANNQLGFTTTPSDGRSTRYASDLAKGFEIPIIHVNADDPIACIGAARLAHAYRARFHKDVLIDLIGYRRWGHNEGDEPSFTQPAMYARISKHPTVREIWARALVERGVITEAQAQQMLQDFIEHLHNIRRTLQDELSKDKPVHVPTSGLEAGGKTGGLGHSGVASEVITAVPEEQLSDLNQNLYQVPSGFHLHPKLERTFANRRAAFQEDSDLRIEWAHAESLAFASILADGTPIRITGQDVGRGTFSHRHMVLTDVETGETYTPLQALSASNAGFAIWNSPLSEQATLGFEFGYSVQAPETLVLWEAQYGDFVNVPQAIIDQFIVSARSKWEQYPSLVMLLPHGYEGQGPEHSSARLERFLQMAAEDNIRVGNCTTAAQYFHILRRQKDLLSTDPRPLILMTPKSLLRHPGATSAQNEFIHGRFQPVLDDVDPELQRDRVRRLVLCSGKVYFDFSAAREAKRKAGEDVSAVAAVRVEELYPFPAGEIARILATYPNVSEVVWLQEEPRNMGAWTFVAPRLRDLLSTLPVIYIGRTRRSSPSEGSHQWHVQEQNRLVEAAFTGIGEALPIASRPKKQLRGGVNGD